MGFWEFWRAYSHERKLLRDMRRLTPDCVIYDQPKGEMELKSRSFTVIVKTCPVQDNDGTFCIELSGGSFLSDKKVLQAIWRALWEEVAIAVNTFNDQPKDLTFSEVEARVRPLTFNAVVYHTIEV